MTVASSPKHANIWVHLKHLGLRQNMRLLTTSNDTDAAFGSWLQRISHEDQFLGRIPLPSEIWRTRNLHDFLRRIYPYHSLLTAPSNPAFFAGRTILAPLNEQVDELNDILLNEMPGTPRTLYSHDDCITGNDNPAPSAEITPEVLNTLTDSGLPLSHLRLKIGAPVVVLRNLHPSKNLCNGTRATVTNMKKTCIEVRLEDPNLLNPYRLLYRCKLTSNNALPFTLIRRQFPVRLAYAMTINTRSWGSPWRMRMSMSLPWPRHKWRTGREKSRSCEKSLRGAECRLFRGYYG